MSRSNVSGHFLAGAKGQIFVLLRRPVTAPVGCVLVVPPFAEEMNKCRRMTTEVALGLEARGIATVVPDLYGTGDSGGEFAEADWVTWQGDLATVARWCADRGMAITALLAVRLGCALAISIASDPGLGRVTRSALWQPALDGGRILGQFLRLRTAASLMDDRKETVSELRTRLEHGDVVEVAGYGLSGRLAADLEAVKAPARLPASFGEIGWMEVVREPGAALPTPSVQVIDRTRESGGRIADSSFPGEPFWSSTEIVVNRDMVAATIAFLGS